MAEGLLSVQYRSLSEKTLGYQRSVAGYAHGMAWTDSVAFARLTDVADLGGRRESEEAHCVVTLVFNSAITGIWRSRSVQLLSAQVAARSGKF